MNMRLIHLKIKIKSLADESRLIKHEEKKMYGSGINSLREHRIHVVRPATRVNHLAYGLLKGRPYSVMERSCQQKPDFKKVANIAERFGGDPGHIAAWLEDAKTYLKWSGTQRAA